RDTAAPPSLPDVAENFAAEALLAGLLVGHDALRGGQDGDTQPPEHPGDLVALGVDPEPGAGDPPQTRDDPRLIGTVLQVDPDHTLVPVVDPLEVTDKAFI